MDERRIRSIKVLSYKPAPKDNTITVHKKWGSKAFICEGVFSALHGYPYQFCVKRMAKSKPRYLAYSYCTKSEYGQLENRKAKF